LQARLANPKGSRHGKTVKAQEGSWLPRALPIICLRGSFP
jgi:hypothetical protein